MCILDQMKEVTWVNKYELMKVLQELEGGARHRHTAQCAVTTTYTHFYTILCNNLAAVNLTVYCSTTLSTDM